MAGLDLEIICHTWAGQLAQYAHALRYQLSSLRLHPPAGRTILVTVCCDPASDHLTAQTLHHFAGMPPGIMVRPWPMERTRLMRRAIGRNEVALQTNADVVWFAGCDYVFGDGCLEAVISETSHKCNTEGHSLFYPETVLRHRTHELGDAALAAAAGPPRTVEITPDDFEAYHPGRGIGCLQIVSGLMARVGGYLPHSRWQNPEPRWARTKEDVAYRRSLNCGRGHPIEVPNLYRLRHTEAGRDCDATAAAPKGASQ